jgi:hypothetical protein
LPYIFGLSHLKTNPPLPVEDLCFGDSSGMQKVCVIDPSGQDVNPVWKCNFAF